uniref:Aspartoacylase n=1 Tax=Globodera pallida TaxID=36090 RepID=A0A183CRL8_GLOPA
IYDGQMYNYATIDHEEPMDFAVVEPVFPKFGEVLKMNQCGALAEIMEQLNAKAAAHGGLSEGKF